MKNFWTRGKKLRAFAPNFFFPAELRIGRSARSGPPWTRCRVHWTTSAAGGGPDRKCAESPETHIARVRSAIGGGRLRSGPVDHTRSLATTATRGAIQIRRGTSPSPSLLQSSVATFTWFSARPAVGLGTAGEACTHLVCVPSAADDWVHLLVYQPICVLINSSVHTVYSRIGGYST